jgi:hypothetical protein
LPYILFTALFLLVGGWFHFHSGAPTGMPVTPGPDAPTAALKKTPLLPVVINPPAAPAVMAAAVVLDPQEINDRITDLNTLAMNDDADSLKLILEALTDADPLIRAAALEATIQFNSPAAIPALQEAMAKVELPQEKVDFQAAIDFLKLPSFSKNEIKSPPP